MSKFCVKKPFFVLVAVIVVLIIGGVSLSKMQTDLLPDMEVPYLIVVTTEPGASPEKVETDVTKPMENALGVISGVKNVTSTSSENYGIVMLEFADDTDMDSALVKVSNALDSVDFPAVVKTGETPTVELRHHINHCITATGPTAMGYQLLRGKVYRPDEFEMKSMIRVSAIDLAQINGDLLERAQRDCFDALVVAEDRMLKRAWDETVGLENDLLYITGELTPRYLSVLRNTVGDWQVPVSTCVMASDYWNDIIGSAEWQGALDPVSKYDLVFSGRLSTIQGMEILTDGFRPQEQRVLNKGELYVVADAEYHAVYSNRGGATSTPINAALEGSTDKGWLVSQLYSLTLPNARTVAKAVRVK
jgi:hypothetical protein